MKVGTLGALATVAAVVAAGALVWSAADGSGDAPRAGPPPEGARVFNLPGRAQVAVSSGNHRDLDVRWRDAAGKPWSRPDVVFDADGRIPTLMRIRVGGPTLALFATYTPPDTYYDDEIPMEELTADDVTVFVVCRDGSCTTSREYAGTLGDPPQVTPDGEHVLLAEMAGSLVTWQDGAFADQHPTGLPAGEYAEPQPLLAPDGSLRAVLGEPDPDGCDFTLFATDPGRADFGEAARHQDPGDHRDRCTTAVETFSSDYVVVSHGRYDAWFLARTHGRWRRVAEDPSGQVRYPRPGEPRLAGAFVRSGFWHWREVVASSPDGRTLVVQVHYPGRETWGPPRVVAHAPRGSECTAIEPMPTYTWGEEDPFYINLRCRTRGSSGADPVYSYPTAVTDDGRTWHSFLATDTGVRTGRDLFFAGPVDHRWSPGAGLHPVRLPVRHGERMTPLSGGHYALSSLVPTGAGCRVEVRLAGPDDSGWSEPLPSTARSLPPRLCALGLSDVSGENLNVYHYFGHDAGHLRMVRLVWRDGEPVVEDGPS